jgi:hypothetical protein
MNHRVKAVLNEILEKFKSGEIPQAVAYSLFPIPNIPSTKWSLLNRTLMFLAGTQDGRGFRQWQQANRYVKKGAKAFYILVPCHYKKEVEGEEKQILGGFKCSAVFRYEDTDGEELTYLKLELPEFPLIEKAQAWGVSVKAIPGNYKYYGYYSSDRQEIALASQDEGVFFHELSHAAHEKLTGGLKRGQDPLQEIVAELAAQALCRLVGKQAHNTLGSSYQYIEKYAEKIQLTPLTACLKALNEVEKVLTLILKNEEQPTQAAGLTA